MNINNRIRRLEKKMNKKAGKIPPEDLIHVVYEGDPNFEDKVAEIRKRLMDKYGTLEGVQIVMTWVPEPDFLPEKFKDSQGNLHRYEDL